MINLHGLVARPGAIDVSCEDAFLLGRAVWLRAACPRRFAPSTPVLFVHHGDLRNGAELRSFWQPFVDEARLLVIALEFPSATFPGPEWYSLGNRIDPKGEAKPREQWTYGMPGRVFAALREQGIITCRRYGLFGHSSGGQFVHRALSLGFHENVALAATANAGTYAMPHLDVAFPYGLGGTGIGSAELRDLLALPLVVFAGTADIDATSIHFPREDAAMLQGPTRYARAHAYVAAARDAAQRAGDPCAWKIVDVPDVGHDAAKMSAAAVATMAAALHASEM